MVRRPWTVAVGLALVTGCAQIASLGDLEIDPCYDGRCSDAATRDEERDDAGAEPEADASTLDAEIVEGSTDGGVSCPGTAGPAGIAIPGTTACVDRTEVTFAQYQAFVTAMKGDAGGQIPSCAGNASYVPVVAGSGDFPVTSIDWCDAYAYCKWAGKRLCGRMPVGGDAGGALDPASLSNPVQNQWLNACTSSGVNNYNYPGAYVAGNCNDYTGGNAVKAVASFPKCRNAAGHVDMSGNVWEFLDDCTAADGTAASASCAIMGGGYTSGNVEAGTYPAPDYRCGLAFSVERTYQAVDLGFRCCSP